MSPRSALKGGGPGRGMEEDGGSSKTRRVGIGTLDEVLIPEITRPREMKVFNLS